MPFFDDDREQIDFGYETTGTFTFFASDVTAVILLYIAASNTTLVLTYICGTNLLLSQDFHRIIDAYSLI
jgi:hypothetical protein